jgi:hypothetical protein
VFTTRRSKPVEKAAAQAVAHPGSEVAGSDARPVTAMHSDGTWARLRRRRPLRGAGRRIGIGRTPT